MKHFQIGQEGLGRLYKAVAEQALDRIIGERLGYPSPLHDRIDLAHARMFALSPAAGEVPSRSLAVEALQAAGINQQEILDVVETIDVYRNRSLVSDGQLAIQLKADGFPVTAENLARARATATAAMAQACLSALSGDGAEIGRILGVPVPQSMARFGSLLLPGGQLATAPTTTATTVETGPLSDDVRDGPFSLAAEAVITRRLEEGLWDGDRAREVGASVHLIIGANGDIPFATVRQHHLFACVGMMGQLPKRYNHFMVEGQGGFAAALASVAAPAVESKDAKEVREAKIGLHSGTRNKHLTWLKAVVEGASVAGFTKHALDFRGLRHNAKQSKKTDKRKKHEKRPNWTAEKFAILTSGPVYEGCPASNAASRQRRADSASTPTP